MEEHIDYEPGPNGRCTSKIKCPICDKEPTTNEPGPSNPPR